MKKFVIPKKINYCQARAGKNIRPGMGRMKQFLVCSLYLLISSENLPLI